MDNALLSDDVTISKRRAALVLNVGMRDGNHTIAAPNATFHECMALSNKNFFMDARDIT